MFPCGVSERSHTTELCGNPQSSETTSDTKAPDSLVCGQQARTAATSRPIRPLPQDVSFAESLHCLKASGFWADPAAKSYVAISSPCGRSDCERSERHGFWEGRQTPRRAVFCAVVLTMNGTCVTHLLPRRLQRPQPQWLSQPARLERRLGGGGQGLWRTRASGHGDHQLRGLRQAGPQRQHEP